MRWEFASTDGGPMTRVWKGTTEEGHTCWAYVLGVGVHIPGATPKDWEGVIGGAIAHVEAPATLLATDGHVKDLAETGAFTETKP